MTEQEPILAHGFKTALQLAEESDSTVSHLKKRAGQSDSVDGGA